MLPFDELISGFGSWYLKAYLWLELLRLVLTCLCLFLGASLLFIQLPNYFDTKIRYYQVKTTDILRDKDK